MEFIQVKVLDLVQCLDWQDLLLEYFPFVLVQAIQLMELAQDLLLGYFQVYLMDFQVYFIEQESQAQMSTNLVQVLTQLEFKVCFLKHFPLVVHCFREEQSILEFQVRSFIMVFLLLFVLEHYQVFDSLVLAYFQEVEILQVI